MKCLVHHIKYLATKLPELSRQREAKQVKKKEQQVIYFLPTKNGASQVENNFQESLEDADMSTKNYNSTCLCKPHRKASLPRPIYSIYNILYVRKETAIFFLRETSVIFKCNARQSDFSSSFQQLIVKLFPSSVTLIEFRIIHQWPSHSQRKKEASYTA